MKKERTNLLIILVILILILIVYMPDNSKDRECLELAQKFVQATEKMNYCEALTDCFTVDACKPIIINKNEREMFRTLEKELSKNCGVPHRECLSPYREADCIDNVCVGKK